MTTQQELFYIAQMRRFYNPDLLRQWIARAESGELRTRNGQKARWQATLAYLEETQHVPLEELLDVYNVMEVS